MKQLFSRGKRIRPTDKDLVFHTALAALFPVFLLVVLLFHTGQIAGTNWQEVSLSQIAQDINIPCFALSSGIGHCCFVPHSMYFAQQLRQIDFLWFSQNFLCFRNPFFQCRNGSLHTAYHSIRRSYPAIQFTCFCADSFLLHLADMRAFMHSGYQIQPLVCIGTMINATRQPLPFMYSSFQSI